MAYFKNKILPPSQLTPEELQVRPPLQLKWLGEQVGLSQDKIADARLQLSYKQHTQTFVVQYKKNWTSAALESAIKKAKDLANLSQGDLPMVVLPYLSSDAFQQLANAQVNGLDLTGRGYIDTDDWFLLLDSSTPNPFKNTQTIKAPYQGKSALVARLLLSVPVFSSAEELRAELKKRGGEISQPMVSRALKAFRDDLIIGKQGDYDIVLLQPEKLLDRLIEQWKVTVEQWHKSGPTVLWRGKITGDRNKTFVQLFQKAQEDNQSVMFTGLDACIVESSVAAERTRYVFASTSKSLLANLEVQESVRFPTLEILMPPDETVFFNSRVIAGIRWPDQLQSYLELTTEGIRFEDGAKAMRKAILSDIASKKFSILAQRINK